MLQVGSGVLSMNQGEMCGPVQLISKKGSRKEIINIINAYIYRMSADNMAMEKRKVKHSKEDENYRPGGV